MDRKATSFIKRGVVPAMVGGAVLLGIPTAGLAVTSAVLAPLTEVTQRFTPAGVDPALAERINQRYAAARKAMRFTPATNTASADRTVTVAVRLDDATAKAITFRAPIAAADSAPGKRELKIAPSRFDLGVARGLQSFAKPAPSSLPGGVSKIEMPDLAEYRPGKGVAEAKPSRFQPRISLENERNPGRAPRTLEGSGEQAVDVSGSYRLGRNIDVTAGVRLSQERSRLAPLTDGVEDDQAVYVGTQLRF